MIYFLIFLFLCFLAAYFSTSRRPKGRFLILLVLSVGLSAIYLFFNRL